MKIAKIYGRWTGIYEWGKGFVSQEKALAWKDFWQNFDGCMWHFVVTEKDSGCAAQYLVGIYSNIFLHPMDFRFYHPEGLDKFSTGLISAEDMAKENVTIKELYKVCNDVAEACGGKFSMKIDIQEVNFNF